MGNDSKTGLSIVLEPRWEVLAGEKALSCLLMLTTVDTTDVSLHISPVCCSDWSGFRQVSEGQQSRASGQSYRNTAVWIVGRQVRLQGRLLKQQLLPHPLRWFIW